MLAETISALDQLVASTSASEVEDRFALVHQKVRSLLAGDPSDLRAVLFRAKYHVDRLAGLSFGESVRPKLIQLISDGDNQLLSVHYEQLRESRRLAFLRHAALMQNVAAGEIREEQIERSANTTVGAIDELEQADLIASDATGTYRPTTHGWSTLHEYELALNETWSILATLRKGIGTLEGLAIAIGRQKLSHLKNIADLDFIELRPPLDVGSSLVSECAPESVSRQITITEKGHAFLQSRQRLLAGARNFTLPSRAPNPTGDESAPPHDRRRIRAGFGDVRVLDRPYFLQPDALTELDFIDEPNADH